MPVHSPRSSVSLELGVRLPSGRMRSAPEQPVHILVLGDFGGRTSRGQTRPASDARVSEVGIDTLDALFSNLKATLRIELPSMPASEFPVAELDDLHPDRLFERHPAFARLRQLREMLSNPATFALAAQQLMAAPRAEAPAETLPPAQEPDDGTLQRLLGRAPEPPARKQPTQQGTDAFIRELVAPHIVQAPDPRRADLLGAVDAAAADLLRAMLHHPEFQALERAWRGLDQLVRNADEEVMRVFVADVTRAELAADLLGGKPVENTALHRMVIAHRDRDDGATPFAIVVGLYAFRPVQEDAALLARVAATAAACGTPFVSGADFNAFSTADPSGSTADRDAWSALRNSADAPWVGLAAPGFLLRLPYGKGTNETERLAFQEVGIPPRTSDFLWGDAALFLPMLLGQAPGASENQLEMTGLPVHWYKHEDETVQTPCAQAWLTVSQAEALLARGIMPLLAVRGRDAVRMLRWQSIASSAKALAGWSE